jgi:hypothetical protein
MPLAEDEERAEYERRMDQMALNIEKMRADMALDQKKFQAELDYRSKMLRWEPLQALSAAFGAGVAVATALIGAALWLGAHLFK